ncbi:MAG: hypothetical protein AABW53_02565 [Nanoarchaeota archaeon]
MTEEKKDLAYVLFEGTPQEKALYLAQEKGCEPEMKDALKGWETQDVYRRIDITHLVNDVISRKKAEIVEEEFESIDAVVEYQPKPSMLKVAAKGTANLARKMHLHQWYYPLVGALPGKYQKEFAKRHGDDCFNYTLYNALLEGITIMGLVSYSTYLNSF